MSSEDENFHKRGPKHLLTAIIDWKNIDHQRSIVAGLVQGVYSLEMDRERKNLGSYPEDNAEPWWTSFNFHLDERLIDDDKCIFGAIYKYNGKYASGDSDAPEYVIAFRGTLLMPETMRNDITLDFKCFFHKLEESSRFKLALNHVEHLVKANRDRNVWLAGHSLGSAIALLVGKKMILNMKWYPKAYLFNPPFLSFVPSSIEMLENEKVKTGILGVRRMLRAGLTLAAEPRNLARMEEHLALLSPWTPHMFVNPADIFCVAYIDYFKSKDGAREIMKLAENNSIRNLVNHVVFRTDLKHATHLLPSAHLIVNESQPNKKAANNSSSSDFLEAHTISQWWRPGVRCQSTLYQHQH